MSAAVVVGAGPNGLAAAVALAQRGIAVTVYEATGEIGGGTRTRELTLPGLLHDVCSAVHPFGVASPFFASLELERYGLRWCWPEVELAHPLEDGRAAALVRSVSDTAASLGTDGPAWQKLFAPLVDDLPTLLEDVLQPLVRVPRHPLTMARFGVRGLPSATWLARRFKTEEARALFAGVAAHAIHPLTRPTTAAVGLVLAAVGHHVGWPVAQGGSAAISNALAALLKELGGVIHTNHEVQSLDDLPRDAVVMMDVAPQAFARIAGARLPSRIQRAMQRWQYGPAAFKVDLAVEGGIPWTAEVARRAGTVHVGGSLEEIAFAEHEVHAGRMPQRPFVLVGQQYLADPTRSKGNVHPVWTYAHVPNGWQEDATELLLKQLERFAPGVRERIVGRHVMGPQALQAYNSNYVGGDISTGENRPTQVFFRPRVAADPYATGIPGVFLCSAATPPGAGVHGMCGANAASSALSWLARRQR